MQSRVSGARKTTPVQARRLAPPEDRARSNIKPAKPRPPQSDAPASPVDLARGQVWKTEDAFIQILDVGKTLVHYRKAVRADTKGTPVKINSRMEIQTYLRKNRAVLVTESAFKTRA